MPMSAGEAVCSASIAPWMSSAGVRLQLERLGGFLFRLRQRDVAAPSPRKRIGAAGCVGAATGSSAAVGASLSPALPIRCGSAADAGLRHSCECMCSALSFADALMRYTRCSASIQLPLLLPQSASPRHRPSGIALSAASSAPVSSAPIPAVSSALTHMPAGRSRRRRRACWCRCCRLTATSPRTRRLWSCRARAGALASEEEERVKA